MLIVEVEKEGEWARKYFIQPIGKSSGQLKHVPLLHFVRAWRARDADLSSPGQRSSPDGDVEPCHAHFATVAAAGDMVVEELNDGQGYI